MQAAMMARAVLPRLWIALLLLCVLEYSCAFSGAQNGTFAFDPHYLKQRVLVLISGLFDEEKGIDMI